MASSSSTRAPQGAAGARRRERPEWERRYLRAQRTLESAIKLVFATLRAAAESERWAKRRPIGTSRRLTRAIRRMTIAALRVDQVKRRLDEVTECLGRKPDLSGEAELLVDWATERCQILASSIQLGVADVCVVQLDILEGLATGELVPEHPSDSGPCIILHPRPLPVLAFLAARRRRVRDRIGPVLLRRRRISRPAEVRVPRRNPRGRAPPLSPACLL